MSYLMTLEDSAGTKIVKARGPDSRQWADLRHYPINPGGWSMGLDGHTVTSVDEAEAKHAARRWNVFSGEVFGSPQTRRLLPPVLVPELRDLVMNKIVRNMRMMFAVSLVVSCAYFILFSGLVFEGVTHWPAVSLMLLISVYFWLELHYTRVIPGYIPERILFINWLKRERGWEFYLIPWILLVFGLSQAFCTVVLSEVHLLVAEFGIVFSRIDDGEYWRFLIGPFLHANLAHWAVNMIMLVICWALMAPFRRGVLQLLLFYVVTILSGVSVYLAGRMELSSTINLLDGFAGISGGIFYIQGFLIANILTHRDWYPEKFLLSVVVIVGVNLAVPALLEDVAGQTAHVFGLMCGLALGWAFSPRKSASLRT